MQKTGLNWFGPVFGGFWRFRSGFFRISKLGNRLRLRFTQKRQKNRTGPDWTSFHYIFLNLLCLSTYVSESKLCFSLHSGLRSVWKSSPGTSKRLRPDQDWTAKTGKLKDRKRPGPQKTDKDRSLRIDKDRFKTGLR